MSRFRSKETIINYAGRDLLTPGGTFAESGTLFNLERQYTTQAVQAVGAEAPVLDNFGNSQGSQTFSITEDYQTVEGALMRAEELQRFCDEHPLGILLYQAGDRQFFWEAGISSFTAAMTCPPRLVRMTFTYTFLTR